MRELNKYNRLFIIILFINLIANIVLIFLYCTSIKKLRSQNNIFYDKVNAIVELKCIESDYGESNGTGVIIDNQGTIFTNAHLILYKKSGIEYEYSTIKARFFYEDIYHELKIIGYDKERDICVLQLKDNNILKNHIKISDNKVKSGDVVYSIGNGLNHGLGITKGIISVPAVELIDNDTKRILIQCDLTINDGNSGGALLDLSGNLIGITTLRVKDNSGNVVQGLCFCIPISEFVSFYDTIT